MKDNLEYKGFKVEINRSLRTTISLTVKQDKIIVRAPLFSSDVSIETFLKKESSWLDKKLAKFEERKKYNLPLLTKKEIKALKDIASVVIKEKVEYYSLVLDVDYGKITIRQQKTLWGSCSSNGNLSFNCLLMLTDDEIINYVVVHELAHRKYMNHSKEFYHEIENVLPNYKVQQKWLKDNGWKFFARLG